MQENPPLRNQSAEYICDTAEGPAREVLDKKLVAAAAKFKVGQKEGVMGSMMEDLKAEGHAKGRIEGRAEGLVEGEAEGLAKGVAKSLTSLLEFRFGPLPAAVQSRINWADLDELYEWLGKVLDATSLEVMFPDEIQQISNAIILDEMLVAGAAKYKAGQKEGILGRIVENLIVEGCIEGRIEGRAEGVVEGEKRGLAKGAAKSLTLLLERRFAPLPATFKLRVDDSDLNQIDAWIDRVADAKSLDEVFAAAK